MHLPTAPQQPLNHHVIENDPDWDSPVTLIGAIVPILGAKTTEAIRTSQLSRLPYQVKHSFKIRVLWAHQNEEKREQGDRFG